MLITIEIGGNDLIGGEVLLADHVLRPELVWIPRVLTPDNLISQ